MGEHEGDLRLTMLAYATKACQAMRDACVSIPPLELRGGGWRPRGGDEFDYSLLPGEEVQPIENAVGLLTIRQRMRERCATPPREAITDRAAQVPVRG